MTETIIKINRYTYKILHAIRTKKGLKTIGEAVDFMVGKYIEQRLGRMQAVLKTDRPTPRSNQEYALDSRWKRWRLHLRDRRAFRSAQIEDRMN